MSLDYIPDYCWLDKDTEKQKARFCPYRYKLQHVASKEATVLHPCSQTGTNAFTVTGSSRFFYVHHQEKVSVQTRKTYFPKSPRCPRCSRFKDNHIVPCSKCSFISKTNTFSSFLMPQTSQLSKVAKHFPIIILSSIYSREFFYI